MTRKAFFKSFFWPWRRLYFKAAQFLRRLLTTTKTPWETLPKFDNYLQRSVGPFWRVENVEKKAFLLTVERYHITCVTVCLLYTYNNCIYLLCIGLRYIQLFWMFSCTNPPPSFIKWNVFSHSFKHKISTPNGLPPFSGFLCFRGFNISLSLIQQCCVLNI